MYKYTVTSQKSCRYHLPSEICFPFGSDSSCIEKLMIPLSLSPGETWCCSPAAEPLLGAGVLRCAVLTKVYTVLLGTGSLQWLLHGARLAKSPWTLGFMEGDVVLGSLTHLSLQSRTVCLYVAASSAISKPCTSEICTPEMVQRGPWEEHLTPQERTRAAGPGDP